MIETQYISHGESTNYRIRLNPDDPLDTVTPNAILEWKDHDQQEWVGGFFIGNDQILDVVNALLLLIGKEPV